MSAKDSDSAAVSSADVEVASGADFWVVISHASLLVVSMRIWQH